MDEIKTLEDGMKEHDVTVMVRPISEVVHEIIDLPPTEERTVA